MIPDTNIGGKIATISEVFNEKKRHSFSTEFKHEASCLLLGQGYSIPETSRSLDVGETALRRWVQQLKFQRGGGAPVSTALTAGSSIKELVLR